MPLKILIFQRYCGLGDREGADHNALQQLSELIKQNFNHPSIFVWGLHNEVLKDGIVSGSVNLTTQLHNLAKDLDPSRFTSTASNIWWLEDHPIHELSDLQGFNQYTGWYDGQPAQISGWINGYHKTHPDVRMSVSEYGAGGNIFQQTNNTTIPEPPNPGGKFFSETYQTQYHEKVYAEIEKSPFIWASYGWIMFDHAVPGWDRGGIKGRNHKGLITHDRNIKKDAFYWYKANWSNENVLYLTGRRNNMLKTNACIFSAYCNFATPELFIDGKSQGKMIAGVNSVQHLTKEIKLTSGQYKIEVKAVENGKSYHDEYIINVENIDG